MRFFNRMGPVEADWHYRIPPLERVDLPEILTLVRQRAYFVLHAPRQTGKTSTLLALRDLLNSGSEGEYRCVHASLDIGRIAGRESGQATRQVLSVLQRMARTTLGDHEAGDLFAAALRVADPDDALTEALSRWCEADPRPLVLLLDEVDTLTGDALLSVLSQLRSGYPDRPDRFPQSVVLCGLQDVTDYRAPGAKGNAFNIKAKSLRLGDFSEAETRALLGQHTEETGQAFAEEALAMVWRETRGQPWLVNALADEACFESRTGRDRSRTIAEADIRDARERLIEARPTHLDYLASKLEEARVRRVIEPMLSGDHRDGSTARDIEYVRDLGLIAVDAPVRIANPIYAEVIPRELTWALQEKLPQETAWYVGADGGLEVEKLLAAFQQFFREHSEHWAGRFEYAEAGPQLILQGFLQRIVNGGGRLEREYGLGRGRTDLMIAWPRGDRTDRFAVECKVQHGSRAATIREGLGQLAGYMDRLGGEAGHLVVFDRSAERSWEEKIYRREEAFEGRTVTVWGM